MPDRFAPLDARTAPDGSRSLVAASERQFGFVPSPVARAARSPALLAHMLAGFRAFEASSLTPEEREVVALSVAFEHECHYCMAMHSAKLARHHGPLADALRTGTPLADARLEALRQLARALVRSGGRVPAELWRAFEAAGYSEEQGLDVVLGVGVYALSTTANNATEAPLDPPFAPFAWSKP